MAKLDLDGCRASKIQACTGARTFRALVGTFRCMREVCFLPEAWKHSRERGCSRRFPSQRSEKVGNALAWKLEMSRLLTLNPQVQSICMAGTSRIAPLAWFRCAQPQALCQGSTEVQPQCKGDRATSQSPMQKAKKPRSMSTFRPER